jgi:hypothetical protein
MVHKAHEKFDKKQRCRLAAFSIACLIPFGRCQAAGSSNVQRRFALAARQWHQARVC